MVKDFNWAAIKAEVAANKTSRAQEQQRPGAGSQPTAPVATAERASAETGLVAPGANYRVSLRIPHPQQRLFKARTAKRRILRAGRRFGKTLIAAEIAVERFLGRGNSGGQRVLYAAPTIDQVEAK